MIPEQTIRKRFLKLIPPPLVNKVKQSQIQSKARKIKPANFPIFIILAGSVFESYPTRQYSA